MVSYPYNKSASLCSITILICFPQSADDKRYTKQCYTSYDSQNHKTTKILDLDACVSNEDNYQIKRRMKDVKFDEESDGPVLFTKLNTIRSNICIPSPRELQNRNALSPPPSSCMMQGEAEQESTLSICAKNEDQPEESHVQVKSPKNCTTPTTISSPFQVACRDEGLTAAAQHKITACQSTLTLGKGCFRI